MIVHVSLTRLRIRSIRFMPKFGWHTFRSQQQISKSAGFLEGALLADRSFTFWTMTAWESQEHMRAYMVSGSHKAAMPHLMHWCDEASVAHWSQETSELPAWEDADRRMRETGRASKLLHPSAQHAGMTYREPRTTRGGAMRPA